MKKTIRQLFIFTTIGAIGTTGHYSVLIALVELLYLKPVLATTFGFIVGALINYFLNYRFTFRSNKAHSETLSKFLIVAAVGAGINSLIMYFGIEVSALHYMVVQVLATVIVLLWNFGINKYWTFSVKEISAYYAGKNTSSDHKAE